MQTNQRINVVVIAVAIVLTRPDQAHSTVRYDFVAVLKRDIEIYQNVVIALT